MFSQARATHSLLRRHGARRALATSTASASTSSAYEAASTIPYSQRSLVVRPWDGIASMPQALAIIRAIERKYGRIRDFSLLRDPDLPTIYVPYFWIAFRDPESYERVPANPPILKVEVPAFDRTQPGGIGLPDLENLVSSQPFSGAYTDDGAIVRLLREQPVSEGSGPISMLTQVVDVRLEHSVKPFFIKSALKPIGRPVRYQFGAGFYRWGGFAPANPDRSTPWMDKVRGQWEKLPHNSPDSRHMELREDRESEIPRIQDDAWNRDALHVPKSEDVTVAAFSTPSAFPAEPSLEPAVAQSETVSDVATPSPESFQPLKPVIPRLTKRERILAQARENARTPLPSKATPEERAAEAAKAREEAERVRLSMRDRLWKLMGGRWL